MARPEHDLHRALQLDPKDEYANEFLATVYFLEGNLEAALKYWNRVGKPQIAEVRQRAGVKSASGAAGPCICFCARQHIDAG